MYRVAAKDGSGLSGKTTCTDAAPGPGPDREADFLVVGDMASCNDDGAAAVGRFLDQSTTPIIGVGDYAYPDGTPEQFADCFDPKLGRHKSRFSPVAGNHEYNTPGAAPYFSYFGAAAGDPDKGYYAQTRGDWLILYLNSNCGEVGGCNPASQQYRWAAQQVVNAPADSCLAVVTHHPRWSSWGNYADARFLDDVTTMLHDAGLDLLLTGHAHMYERLARVDPDRNRDPVSGFRQFTVGTGGAALRVSNPADVLDISESLHADRFGVLGLELSDDSYRWRFVDVDGNTVVDVDGNTVDQGSDTCNN